MLKLTLTFLIITLVSCNGNRKSNDTSNASSTEATSADLLTDFNDSTITYGGDIGLEYDEMIESSDEWGDISNSNLKFDYYMDIDTIDFKIDDNINTLHTFIKIEYPVGGASKQILNSINNHIKKEICPLSKSTEIGDIAKSFIEKTTKKHVQYLKNSSLKPSTVHLTNEDYQMSLKSSVVRATKNYLAIEVHLDTQTDDSRISNLNFDLNTGNRIKLDAVLKPTPINKATLKALINEKLKMIYFDSNSAFNYPIPSNFYLATNFIAFTFNYYELTPLTEGLQTIYIPYKEISELLDLESGILKTNIQFEELAH